MVVREQAQLLDILHISHMWQIRPGFDYAIHQLGKHSLRPAKLLYYAQKYSIPGWVPEAVRALLLLPFHEYTEQDICYLLFTGYLVLRLRKIQAICSHDLSQSFEIEFVQDKRVPLLPKVLS